jgi:uncharacterized metal-binding protein
MTCLAGVGADLSGFVESAKAADLNIAVDGCPVQCAKKTLERIGITPVSFVLTDYGIEKGKTPLTEELALSLRDKIMKQESGASGTKASGCTCGGAC